MLYLLQGTAGVALAGLLGTVRAQGRPLSDFVNQKIVVVGAGRYFKIMFVLTIHIFLRERKLILPSCTHIFQLYL